ncbi:MAG: phosphatase PAP2 family protein [Prevotellaceae bacterium]|jgi:membrane-associated phospholipid phosphatase|nr:phosphatase PAP2 family protein [Prevotellaceae bacterium]
MKLFCKIISTVFHPLLMSTYSMIWLMTATEAYKVSTPAYKLTAIGGTLIFTGIVPLIPLVVLLMRGKITDINVSVRRQRTLPYIFSCVACIIWAVFLRGKLQMPCFIVSVALASAVALVILLLINLRWKISMHLCCAGSVFAFVAGMSFKLGTNPLWLLVTMLIISSLLAISRVELKAHTPAQTIAGFAVGFITTLLPIVLINN